MKRKPYRPPPLVAPNALVRNIAIVDLLEAMADDWESGRRRTVRGCVEDMRCIARLYRALPQAARQDIYDPGYAGGGYDYTRCNDCGGRAPR